MSCLFRVRRQAVLLSALLVLMTGCAHSIVQVRSSQEDLGMGIVSGTLGEQQRVALCVGDPSSTSVVGQVQALEGGAYLIRDARGQDIRIPHDENTRIDRPAHVGDHIQSWLDRQGRAVLIRSLDRNGR
ncbi:hypothetical protein [Candidatus Nitrospira nitrificans]|uniref:Lipoprotein n=1 Tax=Candidatus Nitrospira nitrificans TaxID=1742973 RepID=A0A0S4LG58_9BACT|nr:hypothetical protein [Candidatus Nitrospira nitrificans]CUS35544.1 conserved exported hypothetical protein [Candidatus Nitrospira nitrificans]